MNKFRRLSLVIFLLLLCCFAAYPKLMGAGEASGGVFESWSAGDRTVFRLDIAAQKNASGPALGNTNTFVYAGADRMEISAGDAVKVWYNSDDADGVIVERIEFINNRPGAPGATHNLSVLIIGGSFVFGLVLLVAGVVYQKRRVKRQTI